MTTVTLATRVVPEIKAAVEAVAKRRGQDIASFLRSCIEEIINDEITTKVGLEEEIIDQIEFIRQIMNTCPVWNDSEALIKKEVDYLWEKTKKNLQS